MSHQRDLDLAYLAGIWDADGYIGLSVNDKKRGSTQYYPRVTFTNTNKVMIDDVARVLDNETIGYHISKWDPGSKVNKVRYVLEMVGFRRAFKFLFIMEPIIRGKQTQAQLLLGFLWSRLRHGKAYQHTPYTADEINIFYAMKELNAKGPITLREHTPDAVAFAAKMCSELRTKGAEAAETMARLARSEGWERSK